MGHQRLKFTGLKIRDSELYNIQFLVSELFEDIYSLFLAVSIWFSEFWKMQKFDIFDQIFHAHLNLISKLWGIFDSVSILNEL